MSAVLGLTTQLKEMAFCDLSNRMQDNSTPAFELMDLELIHVYTLTARTCKLSYNTEFLKALIITGADSFLPNLFFFVPLPSATHNDLDQVIRVVRGTAGFIPPTFTYGSPSLFEMIDLEAVLTHACLYEVNFHPEVQVHSCCNLVLLLWKHSHG